MNHDSHLSMKYDYPLSDEIWLSTEYEYDYPLEFRIWLSTELNMIIHWVEYDYPLS